MNRCCFRPKKEIQTEDNNKFTRTYNKHSITDSVESMLKVSKLYKFDAQTNRNLLEAIHDKIVQEPLLKDCKILQVDFANIANEPAVKVVDNLLFNKYEHKIMTMIEVRSLDIDQFSCYCKIVRGSLETVLTLEKKDIDGLINKINVYRNLRKT